MPDIDPTEKKHSDIALLYCEDPKNDPGGGRKERMRTLNKSYRPDLPQFADAWMCVSGPDGTGTYKVLQKDLPNISPLCWILVGECVEEDQWVSARHRVGDYLELNGTTGWPAFGPVEFVDMAPHQPGNINHITNNALNGTGTAWAYPNESIIIKAQSSGDPTNAVYPISECTFLWRISQGPVSANDLTVQAPTFTFTGGGGEVAQITIKITHTPTGKEADGILVILGENEEFSATSPNDFHH